MTLSTIHPCQWHQQDLDQAGRPLLAFLTAFGVPLIHKAAFISPLADETSLQVSILNYPSLALDVAGRRIKIAWEENVSAHLDFDEELKVLHLYPFQVSALPIMHRRIVVCLVCKYSLAMRSCLIRSRLEWKAIPSW